MTHLAPGHVAPLVELAEGADTRRVAIPCWRRPVLCGARDIHPRARRRRPVVAARLVVRLRHDANAATHAERTLRRRHRTPHTERRCVIDHLNIDDEKEWRDRDEE
jgi:hypothetical protein